MDHGRFNLLQCLLFTGGADQETSAENGDRGTLGHQEGTREGSGDKESETDSGMSEEDLSPFMGDNAQWLLQPEPSGMPAVRE